MVESELAAVQIRPEYVAVVDPETFAPVAAVDARALIAVAARVGTTRLIDNIEVAA